MKRKYVRPSAAIYAIHPCTVVALSQQTQDVYDEVTDEEGLARDCDGTASYQNTGTSGSKSGIWENEW